MNKNKKKIIIILVSILLVIGIGITLFLVFFIKGNDESDNIKPIDADEYFKENGEVVSILDVNDSPDIITEKESIELFSDRGFTEYPIITNYSMDGDYFDDKEIDDTSNDKHPVYSTYYTSSNNEVWIVYVINGSVIAYPASYNMESGKDYEVILSEKNTIFSYDNITNKFYETQPKGSTVALITIEQIDSIALDNLTKGEIDKL